MISMWRLLVPRLVARAPGFGRLTDLVRDEFHPSNARAPIYTGASLTSIYRYYISEVLIELMETVMRGSLSRGLGGAAPHTKRGALPLYGSAADPPR